MSETKEKRPFSGPNICIKCDISFKEKKNLNKHRKKYHPNDNIDELKKHQKCGMCDASFTYKSELTKHLETEHNVCLKFTNETFYTENDFLDWKQKIEKEGLSSFILVKSYKLASGEKISQYKCHRSGIKRNTKTSGSNKQRNSKVKGSVKSGCACPAFIKVSTQTVDDISELTVTYQSVHVGHELEVGTLRLSKDERTFLASALNLGIPMSKILDKTEEQFSPTKRLGCTTRKDLHNIARDYQIQRNIILHPDDSTSVDILVKKMQNENENYPVLIYKPLGGTIPEFPKIEKDDFLLGFMNEDQEKLLELYGGTCIMIDSTHGSNQYGFQLTTILVHDDNHEGMPVATLFSLRTSAEALQPFFAEIKKRLPNFKTNIMMSDETNSFYNSWQAVFNDNAKHLICSWHIITNWFRNVNSKVKDVTKRAKIRTDLKKILTEVDLVSFKRNMTNFIETYGKDEENFVDYFRKKYEKRAEKWAYCYRLGLGINTNMKIERWHSQLKLEETGGVVIKRLEKAIHIVTRAIAKKLIGRIINMDRGKLTSRVSLIGKKHKLSLEMGETYNVMHCNDRYIVTKTGNSSIITHGYDVEMSNKICKCNLRCDECKICIHSFSCTCVVYTIQFIICKHIHYVCQNLLPTSPPHYVCQNLLPTSPFHYVSQNLLPTSPFHYVVCQNLLPTSPFSEPRDQLMDNESLIIDTGERKEKQMLEKDTIVSTLKKQSATTSNQTSAKETLINSIQQLQKRVLDIDEISHVKHVQELINAANSYLDVASVTHDRLTKIPKLAVAPVNKKVEQRKFIVKNLSKR